MRVIPQDIFIYTVSCECQISLKVIVLLVVWLSDMSRSPFQWAQVSSSGFPLPVVVRVNSRSPFPLSTSVILRFSSAGGCEGEFQVSLPTEHKCHPQGFLCRCLWGSIPGLPSHWAQVSSSGFPLPVVVRDISRSHFPVSTSVILRVSSVGVCEGQFQVFLPTEHKSHPQGFLCRCLWGSIPGLPSHWAQAGVGRVNSRSSFPLSTSVILRVSSVGVCEGQFQVFLPTEHKYHPHGFSAGGCEGQFQVFLPTEHKCHPQGFLCWWLRGSFPGLPSQWVKVASPQVSLL